MEALIKKLNDNLDKLENDLVTFDNGKQVAGQAKKGDEARTEKEMRRDVLPSLTSVTGLSDRRASEIKILVQSNVRKYETDYSKYFEDGQCLTPNGSLVTQAQVTKDFIKSQVNQILVDKGSEMDKMQHDVLKDIVERKQLPCKKCSKSYSRFQSLSKHFKAAHQNGCAWTCLKCALSFETEQLYRMHGAEVHPYKTFEIKCEICEKCFDNKHILRKHTQAIHEGIKYACKFCQKSFGFHENRQRHVRQVHTNIKPFQCGQCRKFYGDSGNLKRHIRNSHLMERIACKICPQLCFNKGDLKKHIVEKHSEPLLCKVCKLDFKTKYGLKSHTNKNHTEVPTAYPCPECYANFLTPQNRWKHKMKVHTDGEVSRGPFKCRYCTEMFSRKEERLNHNLLSHPKDEKFKFSCSICGKKEASKIRLDLHRNQCSLVQ